MKILLLSFFSFLVWVGFAQTYSNGSGNWNSAAVWNPAAIPPDNGDTVYILPGDVVSINQNTNYTVPLVIMVRGELSLNQTLTLPSTSRIVIEAGGVVTSGNNGWRLNIGSASWKDFKKDPVTDGVLTDIVLNVELVYFNAVLIDEKTLRFSWTINPSDDEIISIELEKSENGKDFDVEAEFDLKLTNEISYTIISPSITSYYRLKISDYNGDVSYSNVKKILNEHYKITCFPNPFVDKVELYSITENKNVSIEITDILGNKVLQAQIINNEVDTNKLSSGVYFITIFENGLLAHKERLIKK